MNFGLEPMDIDVPTAEELEIYAEVSRTLKSFKLCKKDDENSKQDLQKIVKKQKLENVEKKYPTCNLQSSVESQILKEMKQEIEKPFGEPEPFISFIQENNYSRFIFETEKFGKKNPIWSEQVEGIEKWIQTIENKEKSPNWSEKELENPNLQSFIKSEPFMSYTLQYFIETEPSMSYELHCFIKCQCKSIVSNWIQCFISYWIRSIGKPESKPIILHSQQSFRESEPFISHWIQKFIPIKSFLSCWIQSFKEPSNIEKPFLPLKKYKESTEDLNKESTEDLNSLYERIYSIKNRFKYIGQVGIYKGKIHHWVERKNKRSGYRKNPVNYNY